MAVLARVAASTCAAAAMSAALGQSPGTQVTGSARAVGESPAHTIEITFSCEGEPTCVGNYRGRFDNPAGPNEPECHDTIVAGVRITGLDLSGVRSLQGNITLGDFDWQSQPGQCSPIPGTLGARTYPYTGNWDGSRGSLAFSFQDGNSLFAFTGSFTANRSPAPPVFPMTVTTSINAVQSSASAQIQFRPQDVGTTGSVYVFALAPASLVRSNPLAKAQHFGHMAKGTGKADPPVQCVLAQLNASGQLVGVSAASLQAYVSGVLSASGQSVTILNGVPTVNIGGATFFVGYGPNATQMINSGTNRSAVTIPAALECRPQAPQTGWWWDPPPSPGARSPRDGTGYSIEVQGNLLFFAAFLYDASGRSSWYVSSGRTSLEGSLFVGDLLQASGGQSLGGAYKPFSAVASAGPITLAFNSATSGTMIWPGGTVPLGRFDIVPNGLSAPPRANTPEPGWWWNPAESGRGFFIEWQDGWADLAGYMYDDAGNPVWYITVASTPDPMRLAGTWWSFGNGMTLMGPWQPHVRVNDNVAPVTIEFTSATTATMTLPNGRATSLARHRF